MGPRYIVHIIFAGRFWKISSVSGYGNCYTFNSEYNSASDPDVPRRVSMIGRSNGLTVEIGLDQLDYADGPLTKTAGARIVVHDPRDLPRVDEDGMNLEPNTASSIGYQRVTTWLYVYNNLFVSFCTDLTEYHRT